MLKYQVRTFQMPILLPATFYKFKIFVVVNDLVINCMLANVVYPHSNRLIRLSGIQNVCAIINILIHFQVKKNFKKMPK